MDGVKNFSIDDIREVATDESVEFAIARIAVLSTRPNSHGIEITEDILKRDGKSVLGKWIVAKYDKWQNDTTTHLPDETIVGIVPNDSKITFERTDDGYLVMYVDAIISKIYATDVYKLFTKDNFRNVSVEMSTFDDVELPNGNTSISGLCIYAITILGKKVNGSCPDANMKITTFSEENATRFYNKAFALNKIKDMANDLIDFADNQLKLEDALKGDNMENNKDFSEQPKDEDIVMEEPNQQEIDDTKAVKGDDKVDEVEGEPKEEKVELAEKKDESSDEDKADEEPKTDEESKEKEMSEEKVDEKEEEVPNDKEMSCDDKEMAVEDSKVECEEQPQEKSFSEECVEFAEEEYKEFIQKLFSCDLNVTIENIVELKKFMDNTIKEKTEKRFSEIMVEPKLCLGEKAYNVLFEEGVNLGLEDLDAFETKVKAFCEDAPKAKVESDDELMKFACDDIDNNVNTNLSVDELIKKYN